MGKSGRKNFLIAVICLSLVFLWREGRELWPALVTEIRTVSSDGGQETETGDKVKGTIALTFDDGPTRYTRPGFWKGHGREGFTSPFSS